jgi:hypothetical protein
MIIHFTRIYLILGIGQTRRISHESQYVEDGEWRVYVVESVSYLQLSYPRKLGNNAPGLETQLGIYIHIF